ncbi:MAG TPA: molybdopterin-dependent oxidoreductase [Bryobacteraceae bacterium]|nr:molybdopterin-dependent oxidoreductase [Bryobacteraceae bacterium]
MRRLVDEHRAVTRRFFSGLGAAGVAAWNALPARAGDQATDPLLARAASQLEFLTPLDRIQLGGRGNPSPHTLSPEEFRAAGLTPETWFLEVSPELESKPAPDVTRPLTRALGTALDWRSLMKLAEKHAVRYPYVCSCTNVADPFHTCLWEGVPLREVIWMTGLKANVRRVYYWGYTTPKSERFQSSLPLDRILEEAPGELPVMLAYKMNEQWISGPLGGPVRLIAPGFYANRSIKWLQHMVLTNDYRANDSYAGANNDIDSRLKTHARFLEHPATVPAHTPCAITGFAQVGISGLRQVQYSVFPAGEAGGEWRPATILPAPRTWGGGVSDPAAIRPQSWPMRYAIAHWAAVLPGLNPGKYTLCCRTIDENGIAQPMPRPLPKTGMNAIQRVGLVVT